MDELFADARVFVSAISEGSGIKVRVAEALRRGLAVICSEHSTRGYEGVDRRVLRAYRDADDCVADLASFLSEADSGELRALARSEHDRLYDFAVGVERLRELLLRERLLDEQQA